MPNDRKFQPGEPIEDFTIEAYQQLTKGVEQYIHPPVVAPLEYVNEAMNLNLPEGFYARLSGSGSPYSFFEVYGTVGGNWNNRVRSGKSNAYEVNGMSGLAGKIVWMEPGYPGDYRFQMVRFPGSTPGRTGIALILQGCNGGFGDCGVTVTDPDGVSIPFINNVSIIRFTPTKNGPYTVAITSCANYYDQTITVSVTLGTSQTIPVYMASNSFSVTVSWDCGPHGQGYGDTVCTLSGGVSGTCTIPNTVTDDSSATSRTCVIPMSNGGPTPVAFTLTVTSPRYVTQVFNYPAEQICSQTATLEPDSPCYLCCSTAGCPAPLSSMYTVTTPIGSFTTDGSGTTHFLSGPCLQVYTGPASPHQCDPADYGCGTLVPATTYQYGFQYRCTDAGGRLNLVFAACNGQLLSLPDVCGSYFNYILQLYDIVVTCNPFSLTGTRPESFQPSGGENGSTVIPSALVGNYSVVEAACSYYGGGMMMAHAPKSPYWVEPVKQPMSSKRAKWTEN